MTRPRVLVLTKTTALGGAERLLMNALPHLDRGRFDYRFAAADAGGPLDEALQHAGLPFERLPHRATLDPRNALVLRRRVVRERIDLLHAHLPLVGTLARAAARGTATRVVYTEHNTQEMYRGPSRWLNAATYGWQTYAIAVSGRVHASAAARIGVAARRGSVIPNGLDLAVLDREAATAPVPAPPAPAGAFRLLVPATLAARKGQDVLFDALARLLARDPGPLVVWLAGAGARTERRRLERRAARPDLAGRVHFLGPRRDVFALMRAADAVVLPSRHEGHPLALLEAMALARPVAAAAVGGVPEIVQHGRTGLLVPPERPAALADVLQCLRRDPALCARLGAAARASVRGRFDIRSQVREVEAVYERCLAGARVRALPEAAAADPGGPRL